jgi:hypothetical protein
LLIVFNDNVSQASSANKVIMSTSKNRTSTSNPLAASSEPLFSYQADIWRRLTPGERLRRSWKLRSRIPDLKAVHDRKLFPKP